MKTTGLITRRRAIITGLAAAGGLVLARFPKRLPPTYGNLLRMGDNLTYGMNGRPLPIPHGAPVRLRVERQIGYKSMKCLKRIVVTDTFDDGGKKGNIQNGWAWYNGI